LSSLALDCSKVANHIAPLMGVLLFKAHHVELLLIRASLFNTLLGHYDPSLLFEDLHSGTIGTASLRLGHSVIRFNLAVTEPPPVALGSCDPCTVGATHRSHDLLLLAHTTWHAILSSKWTTHDLSSEVVRLTLFSLRGGAPTIVNVLRTHVLTVLSQAILILVDNGRTDIVS
jgi:hypothetical protein